MTTGWLEHITFDLGGFLAGIFGFVAAIIAVLITLCAERRRAKRELNSLRRALGVEVRLYAANALTAHYYCKSLLTNNESPIHAILIEDRAKLPPSTVYANAVLKIGEFGDCGATLVRFFASIAAAREAAERLRDHPLADNLPSGEIAKAANGLIGIAKMGSDLFPFLKTGTSEDDSDSDGVVKTESAYLQWRFCRENYYPFPHTSA